MVTPVHAGLFATSNDENSGGGFDMAGGNEQTFLTQFSVAHVLVSFAQIVEFLLCHGGRRKGLEISGFEALDDDGGPATVEQTLEEAVLFARGFGRQSIVHPVF